MDHIQFDFSKYYLYIYGISFPATNIAKKHPTVEDTVNAKLLADSRVHAEQFRLLNEAIPWRNLKDIDFKKNYFCQKTRYLSNFKELKRL